VSRRVIAAWCVMAVAAAAPAGAETVDEAYAASIKDYYAGHYKQAADAMERILGLPMHDPDLYYNLGCTYFRMGQLGPAIYQFEKTLKLQPDAEDARHNLETCRALAEARVQDELKGAAAQPLWVRAVSMLRQSTWTWLFLGLWWGVFLILLLLRFMHAGPARAGLIAANSFVALLALLSGLMLLGNVYHHSRVVNGIVLPDKMAVHEGPGAGTRVTFKLHAGFRVRLLGTDSGWARIRLANGLEGWVPQHEVGVL